MAKEKKTTGEAGAAEELEKVTKKSRTKSSARKKTSA